MMTCAKCGAALPEMAKFCVMCGNRLDMPIQEQPMKRGFNTSPTTGFSTISDRHYSLEEIAQQQTSDLSEMSFPGQENRRQASPQPRPMPVRFRSSRQSAPPAPPVPAQAPPPAPQQVQQEPPKLIYPHKTPAVPLGEQKQIGCSVFSEEIGQQLAIVRQERGNYLDN